MDGRRSARAILVGGLVVFSAAANIASAAVGKTEGAASVGATGSAQYVIPIWVPPGTAGMQPNLALTYDHRSTNTLLGIGWDLSGLSQISRCARTWAQDGQALNVRNISVDRFCLDGQKLRLSSGTYGANNAEYRTEIESFARVRSYGTAGNGPAYFVVERKDGLVYEYGNTGDSRIESVGQSTARAWAVNKIRDRSGNAILFNYTEDATNGAYRIASIQYTSNATQGLSAAYSVGFTYETKPVGEIDSRHMAGSQIREITRMTRVDVTYNTTLVRRYQLAYQSSLSSALRSRLASVQDCAGASVDCMPATTFSYQNGGVGLNAQSTTSASVPSAAFPFAIDVNGDGRDDLVYVSSTTSGSGNWMVMLANASGFGSPINTGVANTNWSGAIPIDYNADGLGDILVPFNGTSWWVMLGGAGGLSAPANTGAPVVSGAVGQNAAAADMDGDGLEDLVWMEHGAKAIRYRPRVWGAAFASTATNLVGPLGADYFLNGNLTTQFGQQSRRRLPDFDGDGRAELAYAYSHTWFDGESQQQITEDYWQLGEVNMLIVPNMLFPRFLDLDGDGKDDQLYGIVGGGTWCKKHGTGTGFTAASCWGSTSGFTFNQLVVLDWEGDGREDFLVPYTPTGTWWLNSTTNTGIPVSSGWVNAAAGDFDGNGLGDIGYSSGSTWVYRTHAGPYPDLLQTATDGFASTATFSYAPLPQANYSKGTGATFPMQEYMGPLYVVSNLALSNGIGGTYDLQSFYYQTARVDLQGRGFLGFLFRSWVDSRDGTAQRRTIRQDFPYIGAVVNARRTQEPSGTAITEVQTTYSTHSYGSGFETRSFPFASTITSLDREAGGTFNGALIRTTTQQILTHAATGASYDVTTTTTEPASGANGVQANASYVRRTYTPTAYLLNDTTNWCVGRPQRLEQTNSHNQFGGSSITRTSDLSWDASACRLTQEVIEPGHATLQVTRALGYDGFGNLNSDSVTGVGMTARTTTANWGTTGQFPTSVTNALSQTTNKTWNYSIGMQASETDPNGIIISWQYDDFGRLSRENRPDGTATTRTYNNCPGPSFCGYSTLRYYIDTRVLDTASSVVNSTHQYFDAFDRLRFHEPLLVTGSRAETIIEYDALGRVAQRSSPHLTTSIYWTQFQYDLLNRVTQVSRPTSDSNPTLQTTTNHYEGLTTRTVDPLGKQTTKVANVLGSWARSIDHNGYYQSFDYDAFGNAVRVMDSLSNTLQSNTFNMRGMRTAQTDMSAGSSSFTPNALGEIVSQTDAKSQTTSLGFDLLGRMTSRVEPEGTSTFTFGTSAASKNIGRLAGVSGPGYSEGYTYDSIGRPQQRSITSDATYNFNYTYNNQGKIDTLTYPVSTSSYRLKLQYEYANGQLLRVKDFNAPSTVFWQVNSADPWGNVIDETLGNGVQTLRGYDLVTGWLDFIQSGSGGSLQNLNYTWDAMGHLTQRQDFRQSLTENFFYDNLHRLTSSTGPDPITIGYDPRGSITSRTGNVSPGAAHTITWYSYNLPNTISATGSQSSQFFYAPDRSRWKQVASYAGTTEQTIYIGGLVEKVTLGAVTSWKHYIAGATGTVALYTRKSTGTNELFYLTRDHLGSIDSVTNTAGAVQVRMSFSALGQRRNEATWSGNPTSGDWTGITNTTRHGFTFHEMLDNLNLTHMNGRVYDQVIGQFTSPDPFIDGAGSTQGWNRYAYVHSRPLSFVDPSGFGTDEPGRNECNGDSNCEQTAPSVPPGNASIQVNGQVLGGVEVSGSRLPPLPSPAEFTITSVTFIGGTTEPGMVDWGGTAAPVDVGNIPAPTLNIDPQVHAQICAAEAGYAPQDYGKVDAAQDISDGAEIAANMMAFTLRMDAQSRAFFGNTSPLVSMNEHGWRHVPGVVHTAAAGYADARAWGTLARLGGTGAAGASIFLDGTSAAGNFSQGNHIEGTLDTISAGTTAGMLAAPGTAPALMPIWAMTKLAGPAARSNTFWFCMNGTVATGYY
jgi:RHS repeat-associated protein